MDNGSTDGTAEVALASGATVVSEPTPGYGRACLAGLAAVGPAADTIVFLDGDHADYPEELSALLAPIAQGRADLVIGSRVALGEWGSLTVPQRIGNRLACALIRWRFGVSYTDLGPFRAIRREALEQLRMQDRAFGWTVEMQAKAARERLRIAEVAVRYRRRIGRSKISGTISGTILAGAAIVSTIITVALQPPSSEARGREPTAVARGRGQRADATLPSMQALLVFLKYPTPGQVKTRLAAAIGTRAASAVYRACVELTLARLSALRARTILLVEPPEAVSHAREWLGAGWVIQPQQGMDLGERLAAAVSQAFSRGARRVIAIGTDAPWLRSEEIATAFAELDETDVVLGPTEDGGYYLIGLSRDAPKLFRGVHWSSPSVYAQTLTNARTLRLRTRTLRRGYDVDRLEDLHRFLTEERAQGPAPKEVETIAALLEGAPVGSGAL